MPDHDFLTWSVGELIAAYKKRVVSPLEVTSEFLDRIALFDPDLHAFVAVTRDLALDQASAAEQRYRDGNTAPLLGIPTSVKDVFHVKGRVTTLGSLFHQEDVAAEDSGVVRRLRAAGAVFTGKTNTAEFGQSATTDNRLGPDTRNPWELARTPGGSSGGAAASVAARLSVVAVGSDGGGSVRIPAAFTGLFGFKATQGLCPDEDGFRAMTDFICPGPLAATVSDARVMLGVLADRAYARNSRLACLRVGYCPRPEGRPVGAGVLAAVDATATVLESLGHHIEVIDPDLGGWNEIFAPLVLEDERRERRHLLERSEMLTSYERSSLVGALELDPAAVQVAREGLASYRERIDRLLSTCDLLLTPVTAVPAFPLGERPESVAGAEVDQLWGAFPFAVPFSVGGVPAASLPCGFDDGLPVGAQLVARRGSEELILDVCEDLEEAIAFDRSPVLERWSASPEGSRAAG
ncbi:MAG: amidase [Actinomycetota bacterium]